jgi:hypothetical protein
VRGVGLGLCVLIGFLCEGALQATAEEYGFDVSAFHKKPWELGGYLELNGEHLDLDTRSAFYQLRFFDEPRETVDRYRGTLELEALSRWGILTARARTYSELQRDYLGEDQTHKLYEAAVLLQPGPSLALDLGKQVTRWGKGYAWNPVGFIERPKDPDDPTLSREGFWMLRGDWIRSFSGPLQTVAFTPALVPVRGEVNDDFGEPNHLNPAAKLYLLYRDTDVDLLFLGQGSRSARYGIDFAKNLAAHFEIHGELAYLTDSERPVVTPTGVVTESGDAVSYLLGLRYLTPQNITIIAEYYRNGAGFTEGELEEFYRQADLAWNSGDESALRRLAKLSEGAYGRPNPGRHYLYLRANWKEPFDILYFTPSITSIVNLDDQSFSLIPDLLYTGIDNTELRLRLNLPVGGGLSEYGEKQNGYKLELRLRYFF